MTVEGGDGRGKSFDCVSKRSMFEQPFVLKKGKEK
jgi:hypothetical protein